jgi:mannose-6-phosphate isomerase-like protein (cupin superfamily)
MGDQPKVIRARRNEGGWDGIPVEGYRPGAAVGVERHTLVGARKERPEDPGPRLEVRYFELQPGAVSRLEKHVHEHYVIVRRGEGYAVLGESVAEVGPDDVVFVPALTLHQFVNRGATPFGFYCVVEAARDGAQEPSPDELERLMASPAGAVARPGAVPFPARRG